MTRIKQTRFSFLIYLKYCKKKKKKLAGKTPWLGEKDMPKVTRYAFMESYHLCTYKDTVIVDQHSCLKYLSRTSNTSVLPAILMPTL